MFPLPIRGGDLGAVLISRKYGPCAWQRSAIEVNDCDPTLAYIIGINEVEEILGVQRAGTTIPHMFPLPIQGEDLGSGSDESQIWTLRVAKKRNRGQ